MATMPVRTAYLEMKTKPDKGPPEKIPNTIIIETKPSIFFYRRLYGRIGTNYSWVDRNIMIDHDLARIIQDEKVNIFVLYVRGVIAGYTELDRSYNNDIVLANFGLMPEFIGRGLGKYLLAWTIHKAWRYNPDQLRVHTCELDHPAALPNYIKAGFQIYDGKIIQQTIPDSKLVA